MPVSACTQYSRACGYFWRMVCFHGVPHKGIFEPVCSCIIRCFEHNLRMWRTTEYESRREHHIASARDASQVMMIVLMSSLEIVQRLYKDLASLAKKDVLHLVRNHLQVPKKKAFWPWISVTIPQVILQMPWNAATSNYNFNILKFYWTWYLSRTFFEKQLYELYIFGD